MPRVIAAWFAPFACFCVVLAMLFGGGARQDVWSDVVVQVAALPLLAWAVFRLDFGRLSSPARQSLILLCAILALPLIQLIPLPPAVWGALPGRGEIAAGYRTAGLELPWLPVSLYPAATWRAFLSLFPAAAVFLATLSLGHPARRVIIASTLVVAFISVPIDMLQVMGGLDSPLRFYMVTNEYAAVGFFANANHNAAFLYCAIPFAAACGVGLVRGQAQMRIFGIALVLLLLAVVFIGLAIIHQRAGLALGFVAGLSCLVLIWRHRRGAAGRRLLYFGIGANFAAVLLAFQFGFVGLMQKVEQADVMTDLRWPVAGITTQAALANMPLGTGLGTFVPIYDMFAPRTLLLNNLYVNHAHDDWLETWLTGGLPAVALIVAFLIWFGFSTYRLWRHEPLGQPVLDKALAHAASIVIGLLLIHSAVDYPLRTAALSVLFAVACSLLLPVGELSVEQAETDASPQI